MTGFDGTMRMVAAALGGPAAPAAPVMDDRDARRRMALAAYEGAHARRAAELGERYRPGVAYASALDMLGMYDD